MRKRDDPLLSGMMIACDSPARAPIGTCAMVAEKSAPEDLIKSGFESKDKSELTKGRGVVRCDTERREGRERRITLM